MLVTNACYKAIVSRSDPIVLLVLGNIKGHMGQIVTQSHFMEFIKQIDPHNYIVIV